MFQRNGCLLIKNVQCVVHNYLKKRIIYYTNCVFIMLPNPTFLETLIGARINLFIFGRPIGTGHYIYTTDEPETDSEYISSDNSEESIN
jgi:hypothetical protein